MKKYLKFILIFAGFSIVTIFILTLFLDSYGTGRKENGVSENISTTSINIISKQEEPIAGFDSYESEEIGISFQKPKEWRVDLKKDKDCTYPDTQNFCLEVISPNNFAKLSILIVNNKDNKIQKEEKVYFSEQDLKQSKIFEIDNDFYLVRSWWMNAPSYDSKHNLVITHISEDISNLESLDKQNYQILAGGNWITVDNNAYYISYVINQPVIPTAEDLSSFEEIKLLDLILSTLDINFSVNIFN